MEIKSNAFKSNNKSKFFDVGHGFVPEDVIITKEVIASDVKVNGQISNTGFDIFTQSITIDDGGTISGINSKLLFGVSLKLTGSIFDSLDIESIDPITRTLRSVDGFGAPQTSIDWENHRGQTELGNIMIDWAGTSNSSSILSFDETSGTANNVVMGNLYAISATGPSTFAYSNTTVNLNAGGVDAGYFSNSSGSTSVTLANPTYAIDANGSVKMQNLTSGAGPPATILTNFVLYVDTVTGIVYCT